MPKYIPAARTFMHARRRAPEKYPSIIRPFPDQGLTGGRRKRDISLEPGNGGGLAQSVGVEWAGYGRMGGTVLNEQPE